MNKYIITTLCIINSLRCMEQPLIVRQPARESREWNAKAYDEGNTCQTSAFLHFLETNNIKIDGLTILDVGCGTGKLSALYAEKAQHVHGFDASEDMINSAQEKHGHIKNLSFKHCFAEDFKSEKLYQLALASFCIHWVDDKKEAFQRINNSLQTNGEFFVSMRTSNNPKDLALITFGEMISAIDSLYNIVSGKNLTDLIGVSYLSHKELSTILNKTGFAVLKCEQQSFTYTMSNKNELKQLYWPLVSGIPLIKYLPDILIKPLFENFIDRLMEKLPKNDNGSFNEIVHTTIIHARKKS